jgi:hypothetical protein
MIFIVEGYFTWKLSGGNLYTCIRPNQEQPQKMQLQVPGRNRTCGSAIRIVLFCFVDKNTMYLVKLSNGSYKTNVIPKKVCILATTHCYISNQFRFIFSRLLSANNLFTNSNVIEIKTSDCVKVNDLANSYDDKKKTQLQVVTKFNSRDELFKWP